MAKILVIDDSWLIRQTVRGMLKKAGHEVIDADGAHAGLRKAIDEKPDCIILDLLMPDLGGLDLLPLLKENGVEAPVLVLSADIQTTTQERVRKAGATGFIPKPPNEEFLLHKVKTSIREGNPGQ